MKKVAGHPRILVLRGGALGDFIVTLPVFKALRKRWENAYIELIGYPRIAILAEIAGLVDKVQSLDAAGVARFFSLRPQFPVNQCEYIQSFDVIISYLYDPDGTVKKNLLQAGATQVIYQAPQPLENHAVFHLMKPLEELAIFAEGDEFPDLQLHPETLQEYIVPGEIEAKKTVAIHPGSGGKAKNWPVENFLELAARLSLQEGLLPVFFFGEAESDILSKVKQYNIPHPIFHNLSLLHFAKILTHCKGYIGNDSGATHLAAALGLRSVALFGPSDPDIWAPSGPNTFVIRSDPPTAEGLMNMSSTKVYYQTICHINGVLPKSHETCRNIWATRADARTISSMAKEIWREHYVPIIGRAQVDYMLEKFQSPEAVEKQISQGYEYYLVRQDNRNAGYFALVLSETEKRAQLSKIYVLAHARRAGIGQKIIEFSLNRCAALGLSELWLTVNRHNAGSIAFYKRTGFSLTRELKQDIGNGFFMDDYVMTKPVNLAMRDRRLREHSHSRKRSKS